MEVDIDERKIELYADFLSYAWDKLFLENKYYIVFFMITEKLMTWENDAIALVQWLENNQMPSNIEQMFSEFLLERM